MGKTRVYEIAKTIGFDKEDLVDRINTLKLGFTVKNYMSVMTDDQADLVRSTIERERRRTVVEERRLNPTVIRRRNRGEATTSDPTVRRRRPRKKAAAPPPVETAAPEPSLSKHEEEAAALRAEAETKAAAEAAVRAAAAAEAKAAAEREAAQAEHVEVAETAAEETAVEAAETVAEVQAVEAQAAEAAVAEATTARVVKKPDVPDNVTGFIDPETIRKRLAKDNKSFTPGGGPRTARTPRTERKSARTRKVVDRGSLYGTSSGRPHRRGRRKGGRKSSSSGPMERPQLTKQAEHKRVLKIEEAITVGELAHGMGVKAGEVIRKLMAQGMMMTVNQALDADTANLIAQEFGFTVEDVGFKEEELLAPDVDRPEDMELRAPVVTVMGHVDHGKTSLLDAIRDTDVTAGEEGGITQHIGASVVHTPSGGKLVFLDTPGHEAFTALRQRGAKITDIVVLVIAADDGVMPQTAEAINHSRAAGVPIIVAINKIDKPGANPMRVKQALSEYELIPEDWGGSTIFVEVSALKRTNIDGLLEMIALQAEILELKANPDKPARGIVLEARKDIGRGTLATLIVQEGTVRLGDIVVTGATYGRVRTMNNELGESLDIAGPATPVEITGLSDVPDAGDVFFVSEDEKTARQFTSHVADRQRQAELAGKRFDPWKALEETKKLAVIVKGDVQGSVEALKQSLEKLSSGVDEVDIDVLHSGVGSITESDIQLAAPSNAVVIGFNTRPESRALDLSKREGVQLELHTVIYDVLDRIKLAMQGLLDPVLEERELGSVEVRETFSVPKIGTIAGCYVTDGKIIRGKKARVVRNGNVLTESKISSLRRFKDDVKEVAKGFECGLSIDNFNDIQVGDRIEVYDVEAVAATL